MAVRDGELYYEPKGSDVGENETSSSTSLDVAFVDLGFVVSGANDPNKYVHPITGVVTIREPEEEKGVAIAASTDLSKDNKSSDNMITSNLSPQLTAAGSLVFKIDNTPTNEMLFLDGVHMTRGLDYTISDKTITFSSAYTGRIKIGSTLSIMYSVE